MKKIRKYAGLFLCAAVSMTLLCGCSSTALPLSIPDELQSTAHEYLSNAQEYISTAQEYIQNIFENYTKTGSEPESETQENTQSDVTEPENSSLYYYYNQLSTDQKNLYSALLAAAKDPADNQSGQTVRLSVDPESDDFTQAYHVAYGALISDHPELFWLTQGDSGFTYTYPRISLTGTYPVTITLRAAHTQAPQMLEQLETAASNLLDQVDLSQSDPQVALQIHDRLIDLVSYDTAVAQSGGTDLAHTAYGALVSDSSGNANRAVCDGYTLAYEYLLQKAGIRCAVVNGRAGQDAGSAQSHSWILVNLEGQWYETDPTWDDVDLSVSAEADYSGLQREALADSAYTDRLRHYLYDVTTSQMSSFTPDNRYTYYSIGGWVSFLTSSVHIRNQAGDEESTGDYTTPLAPTADGTQYSYSALTGN